jgi:hypothetical protein
MKRNTTIFIAMLTTFLFVCAVTAQGQKPDEKKTDTEAASDEATVPEGNTVEFGFRTFWGDVYGRPDLPFQPDLSKSKLNEYSDIRDNVLLRRAFIHYGDIFGTRNYFTYQTDRALYKNSSHLATFGEYGKFKAQFRYNEIPHVYTNTAQTLYTQTVPGVFTIPLSIRQALQTASSTGTAAQINNSLPSFVATQVMPNAQLFVPQIQRRAATGLFSYNLTPDWTVGVTYSRERQEGTRPIGAIFNSSPSASASSQPGTTANRQSPGTGAEVPEPIDYVNNVLRAGTEFGKRKWTVQLGYNGSYFKSNVDSMLFDNPFATADVPVQIIPPGNGCTPAAPAVNCAISAIPSRGQMSTYPDNHANYLNFAGAFDATKYVHIMGSASNGWLRQNEAFLPYTANTAITGLGPLPAGSLHGDKQTLAMNWTAVSKVSRNFEVEAKYRHYDYNNNTPVFDLAPIQGDIMAANATATGQADPSVVESLGRSNPGYKHKTLELSGSYFLGKRNSAKFGYESDWFSRSFRDVAHSQENSVFGAFDFSPLRDLTFRISGRHQNRKPDEYQDETASDPLTGVEINCTSTSAVFTEEQRCHRRFDEAARILDRGDLLVQYDLGRLSFGGLFQTIQSDFNRAGGTNSPTPLNFIAGNTRPYYLYGMLNDLSWIYSFDTTLTISPVASVFIEYANEKYHKRMISRSRTPTSGTQTILTCAGCDSANNDWESITRDIFNTYSAGFDFFLHKRFWVSPYYSLADGKGNVNSRALGDPTITSGPNQFVLTGTSIPESYPQTTTRIHEAAAVFKFKLTANLTPRFEYRFQQFDNRDYQTTPMTPYMGCVGAGAVVVGSPCVNVGTNLAAKSPSPVYPGFVVGDTAAARYLFLGADQPSYRAHIITVTLEYHF